MTLTVRLKKEHERLLRETARLLGCSQSEIVREAIAQYAGVQRRSLEESARERLMPWLGCIDSGGRDLSVDSGRKFRSLLKKRHEARPR